MNYLRSFEKLFQMNTIGIDFGTTNSAVAVFLEAEQRVIASDYEGTLLYFEASDQQKFHIGQKAISNYLANGLKGRFIRSVKSILHLSSFKYTNIYGKKYLAEDLVALVLSFLKQLGTDLAGAPCDRVVLGRPARFSPDPAQDKLAQDRLLRAAKLAGFKEVILQLEPVAAAFSYEHELRSEKLVLVGDLGGGTADFTIMHLSPNRGFQANRMDDILGSSGVRVGGDDLDAGIAWHKVVRHLGLGLEYDSNQRGKYLPIPGHYFKRFCRWENHFLLSTPSVIQEIEKYLEWTNGNQMISDFLAILKNNWGYPLFNAIENAKKSLSDRDNATILFQKANIHISEHLSLLEFQNIIAPQMQQLTTCMDDLLENSNLQAKDIDAVFLTGGTSKVLAVRKLMEEKFGSNKIAQGDSFHSVAKGLALQGRFA